MNLLLLSNSTNYGDTYLQHAKEQVREFLKGCHNAVFIPYAGVTISHDDYLDKVVNAMEPCDPTIRSIHRFPDTRKAIEDADAILIGGGNTFRLLSRLQDEELMGVIRHRIEEGMKYVGWSAGSNVAGKTIRTTNDMPICEPASFTALNLVPFQINPHFTNEVLPNHGGETRMDRLNEFLTLNPSEEVVCLPEGTWLDVSGKECYARGEGEVFSLRAGKSPEVIKLRHL